MRPECPRGGRGHRGGEELAELRSRRQARVPVPGAAAVHRAAEEGREQRRRDLDGRHQDKIKIVLFLGTHEQQDAVRNASRNRRSASTSRRKPGYFEDSFRDWQEVLAPQLQPWGRKFEFVYVNPTGTDEAAQRADAFTVAEKKPFAVVVTCR